jgi:gamma-glutamylcyclotransferase (GGCT)/AIG2-like uncharacterized protein YtfP
LKVFVYGTLKEGYGNNRRLQGCEKVGDFIVQNYMLYDCGFPVAWPSEGAVVTGELWDIGDTVSSQQVLRSLDSLEAEGFMYNRTDIVAVSPDGISEPAQMYVGNPKNWNLSSLTVCPKNEEGAYVWSR